MGYWIRLGDVLDRDYFNILIFGQKNSKTRHLRIHKKRFKIALYLLCLGFLSTVFFFCDYIQIRKKSFELNQLRQETWEQRSQIHFFSSKIDDLEKQLSRLKEFDRRIRIIANLEKEQGPSSFVGIGGEIPSDIREKLKAEDNQKGLIQQMRSDIERLKSEAMSQENSLSELEQLLLKKREVLAHTPSIWPSMGWVTSDFGFRINPFTGLNQMHEGIDISNRVGTPVIAPADGIVTDTGKDYSLGNVIVISHGFGITTRYCHLNKYFVKPGQKVKRGDKIGEVGMSGKSTGPHLHYEVRVNGIPVNPMKYILN